MALLSRPPFSRFGPAPALRTALIAGSLVAVAALAAKYAADRWARRPAPRLLEAGDFATTARSLNRFVVSASHIAQSKAQDNAVFALAEHLIEAHKTTEADFDDAIVSEALWMSARVLTPEHEAQLDHLRHASLQDFDTAYIEAMIAAHKAAVGAFAVYARSGESGDLKTLAGQVVSLWQDHLDRLRTNTVIPASSDQKAN
ncbi:DUF4142 domain-containing protein [Asticcacaulis sp. YBE204]|uniref:DUF4142 domain-containing protein n=1 Tax=Asticcacaulis sp. YBE204 TaxID=1282363 RepID=UPI0003C4040E|nr:DUF4142 domain-containing protein [Asticcacaulis sp. YBE204]ESQ77893.1 hypothetical protein AEYBE204_16580 [Asticcacaulis sp. YBE204]